MRMDMAEAVARAVPQALKDYAVLSGDGRANDRPPVAPVLSGIAEGLIADFVRTESRAYVAVEGPYAAALEAAGFAPPAVLAGARAGLIVWNHRHLPRGAVEVLPEWDAAAVRDALTRLAAFNAASGPEAGGTVRYGLLVVLSLETLPAESDVRNACGDPAGLRVLTPEPVAWDGGRAVRSLVLELATVDAPTPCQLEADGHVAGR